MGIVLAHSGLDLGEIERAVGAVGQGARMHAAQRRRTALFVVEDMRLRTEDHLVPAPAMGHDGDQVAHGAAGHEQRRLHAQALRGEPLEFVDGGVFAVDVVADLGPHHGLAHGLGRLGQRVAAHVDDRIAGFFACHRITLLCLAMCRFVAAR
ncbi:MAG: hypothetical protein P8011_18725 [Acidihalobacter sp.]